MIVSKFVVRKCKFVSVLEFTSEHILGIWICVLVRFSKIAEESNLHFFENMLQFISIILANSGLSFLRIHIGVHGIFLEFTGSSSFVTSFPRCS